MTELKWNELKNLMNRMPSRKSPPFGIRHFYTTKEIMILLKYLCYKNILALHLFKYIIENGLFF